MVRQPRPNNGIHLITWFHAHCNRRPVWTFAARPKLPHVVSTARKSAAGRDRPASPSMAEASTLPPPWQRHPPPHSLPCPQDIKRQHVAVLSLGELGTLHPYKPAPVSLVMFLGSHMKLERHSIGLGIGSNSPSGPDIFTLSTTGDVALRVHQVQYEVNDLRRSSVSTECPHAVSIALSRSTYHNAGEMLDVVICSICHFSDTPARSLATATFVYRRVSPQLLRHSASPSIRTAAGGFLHQRSGWYRLGPSSG